MSCKELTGKNDKLATAYVYNNTLKISLRDAYASLQYVAYSDGAQSLNCTLLMVITSKPLVSQHFFTKAKNCPQLELSTQHVRIDQYQESLWTALMSGFP